MFFSVERLLGDHCVLKVIGAVGGGGAWLHVCLCRTPNVVPWISRGLAYKGASARSVFFSDPLACLDGWLFLVSSPVVEFIAGSAVH